MTSADFSAGEGGGALHSFFSHPAASKLQHSGPVAVSVPKYFFFFKVANFVLLDWIPSNYPLADPGYLGGDTCRRNFLFHGFSCEFKFCMGGGALHGPLIVSHICI